MYDVPSHPQPTLFPLSTCQYTLNHLFTVVYGALPSSYSPAFPPPFLSGQPKLEYKAIKTLEKKIKSEEADLEAIFVPVVTYR